MCKFITFKLEKSVEGALDAAAWIGIGRWLSPDFWFSPLQGGNPVINALASLLLPIPSLHWLAPSFFQTKCKKLAGGGRGKELEQTRGSETHGGLSGEAK
ncbi:hypothetical protein ACN9MH_18680 [Paenibacillus silvae]|jgi:hypothetical protein|uniref:hypothetical protein n=1 Tax=Paenibacillus silvae TaxID=1325358 RepID=UPI0025A09334|nr:hypothetical protein [Paenibacillus silvae]MDM5276810.1 hypothetical protein [Paenibacillus silvae]